MDVWFGVDIGGTRVKTALVDGVGGIVSQSDFDTDVGSSPVTVCKRIGEALARNLLAAGLNASSVQAVGVGIPGFLELECGVVVEAVNLHWFNVPFARLLVDELGLPVTIENDANVAALGEAWAGAGAGHQVVLCVTVGTGIGSGIVLHGQIHRGVNGMAGEIGHLMVQRIGGIRCNCGQHGCLETLASATAIIRNGQLAQATGDLPREPRITEARQVFAWAEGKYAGAQRIVMDAANWLGYGLSLAALVLNPDVIVIGGGVSQAQDQFLSPVRSAFAKTSLKLVVDVAAIRVAELSNQAGVIGAARLAQQRILGMT